MDIDTEYAYDVSTCPAHAVCGRTGWPQRAICGRSGWPQHLDQWSGANPISAARNGSLARSHDPVLTLQRTITKESCPGAAVAGSVGVASSISACSLSCHSTW